MRLSATLPSLSIDRQAPVRRNPMGVDNRAGGKPVTVDATNPLTAQGLAEDEAKASAALREQGLQRLRAGDLARAIDLLSRAGAQDPDDPQTQLSLGIALQGKRRHAEALAPLERAQRVHDGGGGDPTKIDSLDSARRHVGVLVLLAPIDVFGAAAVDVGGRNVGARSGPFLATRINIGKIRDAAVIGILNAAGIDGRIIVGAAAPDGFHPAREDGPGSETAVIDEQFATGVHFCAVDLSRARYVEYLPITDDDRHLGFPRVSRRRSKQGREADTMSRGIATPLRRR